MADQPSLTKCNTKKPPTDYIKSLHAYAYQHSSIILLIYVFYVMQNLNNTYTGI